MGGTPEVRVAQDTGARKTVRRRVSGLFAVSSPSPVEKQVLEKPVKRCALSGGGLESCAVANLLVSSYCEDTVCVSAPSCTPRWLEDIWYDSSPNEGWCGTATPRGE